MGIAQKLAAIQNGLKAPKDKSTSRYRYRSIEDVNEAVKPLAEAQGCAVYYCDAMQEIGGRLACVSTCVLTDGEESAKSQSFAIVNTSPKGMSVEQACGSASSYARRYAACGLFAIDDSRDDPDERTAEAEKRDGDSVSPDLMSAANELVTSLRGYCDRTGADYDAVNAQIKATDEFRANQRNPEFYRRLALEYSAQ